MGAAVLVVIVVLVLTNLANHYWLSRHYLFTCPVVAVLLVGVGRLAGLSWTELGMGRHALLHGFLWAAGSVLLVAAGYSIALTIPGLRVVTGEAPTTRAALFVALIEAPFATVLLEETAFRGVLWGLLARDHGPLTATVVSSLLFGLWHVAPSLRDDGLRLPHRLTRYRWAMPLWVGGTVLVTAAGGVAFSELRQLSGSLIAPMGLHWATNGLGSAVRLWAR